MVRLSIGNLKIFLLTIVAIPPIPRAYRLTFDIRSPWITLSTAFDRTNELFNWTLVSNPAFCC